MSWLSKALGVKWSDVPVVGNAIGDIVSNPVVQAVTVGLLAPELLPSLGTQAAAAEAALGGTAAGTAASAGLSDLALAGAYDAGLAGVGSNVGAGLAVSAVPAALSDAELAAQYDAALSQIAPTVAEPVAAAAPVAAAPVEAAAAPAALSDAELAAQYDAALSQAGSTLPEVAAAPVDATAAEGTLAKSTASDSLLGNMSDLEKMAALQAGSALVTKLTTPKMPQAATGFTYTSDNKPNYDIKFDDPVHWADIKVPEYDMSNTRVSPYFTRSETGAMQGGMLDAGSDAYKSALIRGLRNASAMPAFVNPGFVNFATNK